MKSCSSRRSVSLWPLAPVAPYLSSLIGLLALIAPTSSHAQYTPLDFTAVTDPVNYTVVDEPIGSTGVSYSMSLLISNSHVVPSAGLADGTIQFEGTCELCGPTVRITFTAPVDLEFTGMDTMATDYWFDENESWLITSAGSTFTLTDEPLGAFSIYTIDPGSIYFVPHDNCDGVPNLCTGWNITASSVTTLDIRFLSSLPIGNGSGIRIAAAPIPQAVPSMQPIGVLALIILIASSEALSDCWRRRRNSDSNSG